MSQIRSGALLSYLSIFIGMCVSITYTPIMLRMLGKSEYGLMTLANSVVSYLSLLNLGIGSAMVRYISKFKAEGDKEKEYGVISLFLFFFIGVSLLMLVIGLIVVYNAEYFFTETLTSYEIERLKILMFLMTINMAIGVNGGVFYAVIMAYERFIFSKVVGIINTVLTPLTMVVLLFQGYLSVGMTVASTILNFFNVFVVVYYCFFKLRIRLRWVHFNISFYKELFGFSFFIIFAMIVDKVYWGTDQLILGAVSGTVAVAIYNIGASFNTYFMSFSTAITGLFLPRLTEMTTKGASDREFSDLFIKVGRVQYLILALVLGGFIILGKSFIKLWAGADYGQAYYIAIVVLSPFIIPLIQNLGLQLMYARNLHKFRSLVLFFIAVLNVCFSIPMAKIYGGLGCALVTGISYIIGQGFILNWFYCTKMKLDVLSFWKEIFSMTVPLLIVLFLSYFIIGYIHCESWGTFLICAVIYLLLYSIVMWFGAMNSFEHSLIKGLIPFVRK